jgi:thiol-disulfide isomerase/thioredoxin
LCPKTKQNKNKDISLLVVKLEKKVDYLDIFDPGITDIQFVSTNIKYPNYYKYLLGSTKGYPTLDSFLISATYADTWRFLYNLNNEGFLSDPLYNASFGAINSDSLGYDFEIDNEFMLFTGIKENEQIVILDVDKNKDFSNDQILKFKRGFQEELEKNQNIFNNLPIIDYNYEKYEGNTITKYERKALIYPNSNNSYAARFEENSPNKTLHIMGKIIDYWQGEKVINNVKYNFVCQGFFKSYIQILVKPDSLDFHRGDYIRNKNFEYRLKDTIALDYNSFVIDSFDFERQELKLKKVKIKNLNKGFRPQQKIVNLELDKLNGEKFNLSDIKDDKQYLLIDFWGTLCLPCLETIPSLKIIQKRHSNLINIIGIANDREPLKVLDYVKKYNISWPQAILNNSSDSNEILTNLRIEYYPTFLLIDRNNQIIHREVGINGLKNIEAFLDNESN